ncbi:MAG: glycosyl transferase family 2 [Ramlibacter sp.]|nr:glycosyl transferase family 2 [Ramlibacter sp.]
MAPITVIIPCYRCGPTIQRAVESIARQTLLPAEVILVDDASDDDTVDCLNQLREAYQNGWIRVLKSARNAGPSAARNAGWDAASQPYVAFLDADDSWHPRKIEIQYQWMTAHPNVALAGHKYSVKRDVAPPEPITPGMVEATSYSRRELLLSNRFSTPTVMLKRSIGNRFEVAKRHSEDFLLWLEICLQGHEHVSLSGELTYLHKAPYGEGGLSKDLGCMARGELDTYGRIYRQGYISGVEYGLLQGWSRLKYLRRIALITSHLLTKPFLKSQSAATVQEEQDVQLMALPPLPLVSIVTPSYNTGQFIAETLRSVRDQGYPRVEHIVLDSGSTDETLEVLQQFPNVTLIRNAPGSMCDKLNLGFSLARGDVVAWLCADDYYCPGAIAKAVDALKQNPDTALVYCNDLRVDELSVEIRRTPSRQTRYRELVQEQNYLPNPTVFMRREALAAVGPVDGRFPLVCDWDLWIRISRRFVIRYVDDGWDAYREREGQLNQTYWYSAWVQGRQMTRMYGAGFFRPYSWSAWYRKLLRVAGILGGGARRAVHSKLRGVTR